MKTKISLIIAVNKYRDSLKSALDSYKAQTLKDIEILLIDCAADGKTTAILQSYISDKRFSYHRLDTGGISVGRNFALQNAKGKYIAFGDDTVIFSSNLLLNMYRSCEDEEAELCVAPMTAIDIYGKHEFKSTRRLKRRRTTSRFDTDLIWNPAVTNKLFLKKKIDELNLQFSAFGKAREAAFSLPFAFEANSIICCAKGFVSYINPVKNEGVSKFPIEHYLDAYELIIEKAKQAFESAISLSSSEFDKRELQKEMTCYIDEIFLKELTVLFYSYYRHFWSLDDEEIQKYTQILSNLSSNLSSRGLERLHRMNRDIFFAGELIDNHEEMAQNPKATICIGKSETRGHLHEKRLFIQVSSIFNQTMPAFELLVDERLMDIFPKEYLKYKNIRFIQAGCLREFKETALEECKTPYIMFQDGFARLNPKVLMRHYNLISGNTKYGFSTSPITKFDGSSVEEYSFSDLVFYSDMDRTRITDDYYNFALDLYFCNKLFRVEHLKGIHFSFSDSPVMDMFNIYRHSKFLKIAHRGAYLSYTEEEAVNFLREQEKFLPSQCKYIYKNYKRIYHRQIVQKRRRDRLINAAKNIKRLIIHVLNTFVVMIFSKRKVKNRAFFYTIRSTNKLEGNIEYVFDSMQCRKVVFAKMLPHSYWDSLKVKYYLLTSKLIVTDDYLKYLRYVRLKDEQKVAQLWHACGAFKRFGLDAPSQLNRKEEYSTHSQYSDVFVSSEYVRQFYAHAFGVDMPVVKALGTPRTDALLNKSKVQKHREYLETMHPLLKNKKIYLYLPTFREDDGVRVQFEPQINWEKLNDVLDDDEIFIISRHPVMKDPFFKDSFYSRIKDYTFESTEALLAVADVVVTDYSSVIFDATLLNIPSLLYCPDYDSYERDFYLNYENLPYKIIQNDSDLLPYCRMALKTDMFCKEIAQFKEDELGACDGSSTKRIAEYLSSFLPHE